jgi:hypothetical protein
MSIKEAWGESREKFGVLVDIGIPLSTAALFAFAIYSKHHKSFDPAKGNETMSIWCAAIPSGLWVLWFVYHLPQSAHKLYLELEEKYQEELEKAFPNSGSHVPKACLVVLLRASMMNTKSFGCHGRLQLCSGCALLREHAVAECSVAQSMEIRGLCRVGLRCHRGYLAATSLCENSRGSGGCRYQGGL